MAITTAMTESNQLSMRKYQIRGQRSDRTWVPALGLFFEADGTPIDLLERSSAGPYGNYCHPTKDESEEYLRRHSQISSSIHYEEHHRPNADKVRILDIMLGMKCNYRCKYCLQNDNRNHIDFDPVTFEGKLRASGLNFELIKAVRIWGGEPFVYWEQFVQLVQLLRERFDYSGKIWTVTNGSLFDQSKCSFCLDAGVSVMFSHDGTAQTILRNKHDYLDDLNIRAAVKRMLQAGLQYHDYRRNFSVSGGILMVLGPYNLNIRESIDYVEKRLFPHFPSKIATVFKADSRSEEILKAYGQDGLERLRQDLLDGLRLQPEDHYYPYFYNLRQLRDTVARHLVHGLPFAAFRGRCPSYLSAERLAFDTEGRILVCYADNPEASHNHGTIEDLASCRWDLKSLHQRPLCRNCPWVSACMGGCPILNDEDHEIRCRSMMPYHRALFESAYEILFDDRITEIIEL